MAKSPERGVLVKVAGKLIPNPSTGNLVATFADLPQLPYTDLNVNFKQTQRAPLITPPACGTARSTIDLTPWSGPATKHSTTDSAITTGIGGGACPAPGHAALLTGRGGRRGKRQRRLLHPLLRPHHPQGHRAGDHLLLPRPAEGDHRQAGRHPLLPRGRDRGGAPQERLRRGGEPLLPRGLPGRPHPDRLRDRQRPHLRLRAGSTSPAPTTARRSRWSRSTRRRSGPSTWARS